MYKLLTLLNSSSLLILYILKLNFINHPVLNCFLVSFLVLIVNIFKEGNLELMGLWIKSVGVIYLTNVVLGTTLYEKWKKNFAFSCYLSTFISILAYKKEQKVDNLDSLKKVVKDTSIMVVILINLMSTIVIPLDWNRVWQKWPVPHIMGTSIALLVNSIMVGNNKY